MASSKSKSKSKPKPQPQSQLPPQTHPQLPYYTPVPSQPASERKLRRFAPLHPPPSPPLQQVPPTHRRLRPPPCGLHLRPVAIRP
ncbi:hypothetical protein CK203_105065 [Vitis vinifera]|uniref:Uncharacterized protein n=1 Tax=Vitis vinifera TaxID=29760 RepID=A0A438FEF0_VITVI|nr:hypothetical protein CK203_105065 [Vitis vinifera]